MRVWVIVGTLAFATLAAPLRAAEDGATRISLAIRQETALQSIGTSACFAMGGVDARRQGDAAIEQMDSYRTVLEGFREGHEWMGLAPTTDPEQLTAIAYAEEVWQAYEPAVHQILANDLHSVVVQQILADKSGTIVSAVALTSAFVRFFGADVTGADMIGALRLAGHYRTLTQRALREMCFVYFDIGGQAKRDALRATLEELDATMQRLTNGDTGIVPPPNARIERNFRTANLFWDRMRPTIEAVLTDAPPSPDDIAKALKFNESVLKQLNQAVDGYLSAG